MSEHPRNDAGVSSRPDRLASLARPVPHDHRPFTYAELVELADLDQALESSDFIHHRWAVVMARFTTAT